MPRSLGRRMRTSSTHGVAYWLASAVIMIRMTHVLIPPAQDFPLGNLGR